MNLFRQFFKKETKSISDDFYNRAKLAIEMSINSSVDVHKTLLKEKNWSQILFCNKSLSSGLLRLHMLERRSKIKLGSEIEFKNKEIILDSLFSIIHKTEVSIADVYYQLNLWIIHNRFDKINELIKIIHLIKPSRYRKQSLYEKHYMNFLNFLSRNTEKINHDFIQKSHKDPIITYYSLFPELYDGILNKTDIKDNILTIKDEYKILQKKLFKDSSSLYGGFKDTEVVTNFTLEVPLKISSNIDKLKAD
ncbi:hypothetical protein H3Z83_11785 [Tenacibaculum sp. S7007]|uniref:Uncharacterized protein n=1 Tax=Tenacibaculum pelagium TaxID=2759527 RepID=A0A839ASW0_9FLAO|nr:hypothetical protein [Tenacibaculum pelagium]MBA6157194.1 hypothetical protein [Tenacibaculum pelagium]